MSHVLTPAKHVLTPAKVAELIDALGVIAVVLDDHDGDCPVTTDDIELLVKTKVAAWKLRFLVARSSPDWGTAPSAGELASRIMGEVRGIGRDKATSCEALEITAGLLRLP